ncbi:MAG: prepilin peptidase [Lachnospiraceae bacterium]|nr:prepilin peptidase [Lachnospiraceae bacterium]
MEYTAVYTYILHTIIFILGILIGSFLNVCICRIPEKKEIIYGRSHCLSCGNVLKWYELLPILSFLLQKGHCRSCRVKLSLQYPLVEMTNGLVYVLVYFRYGLTITSLLYCLCASALIVLTVIDWRTFEIPVGINIFIGVLGIINLITDFGNWLNYCLGFVTVSGLFIIIFMITKGRGIGGGDIKLMAVAGLLLGWQNIILAMVIGAAAGSVIHLLLMKMKGKGHVLAFGPYLSFGIFITMTAGTEIINWYLKSFL